MPTHRLIRLAVWFGTSCFAAMPLLARTLAGTPHGVRPLDHIFAGGVQYFIMLGWLVSTLPFALNLFMTEYTAPPGASGVAAISRQAKEVGAFVSLGVVIFTAFVACLVLGVVSSEAKDRVEAQTANYQSLIAGNGSDNLVSLPKPSFEYPGDPALWSMKVGMPVVWFICFCIVGAALKVDQEET